MALKARSKVPLTIVDRALAPFQQFFRTGAAGGIVLLACTAIALGWANSPWGDSYFHLWEQYFTIGFEQVAMTQTLHHWINDGLMVIFFFLVGLEIKREMLVGELASLRQSAFPIAAALGGMVIPAGIFAAITYGTPGAHGWGIPMATDIAFALGVLALLGPNVPLALKVFLAALAIVDDIGAVLVIAVFYTESISGEYLLLAGGILLVLILCNRLLIRHTLVYLVLGTCLWLAVFGSGVHATVAGVLLAMTVPVRTRIDEDEFLVRADDAVTAFKAASDPRRRMVISNNEQQEALHALEASVDEVQSPLMKMEHALHAPVAFVIMPLFALANAGVRLDAAMFASVSWRVVLGVLLGLVVGKAVGITLFSWVAVRSGFASRPSGVTWSSVHGVAWLAGIGFTMSLFVAGLAYGAGPMLDSAKVGVLGASLLAGAVGYMLLRRGSVGPHRPPGVEPDRLVALGAVEGTPEVERYRVGR
ncbi:MAG: Na+/H+ antiporter NhaA [Gemmatimonadaceae bacterium]|nr:Na+/H+ antiporter NhaA [Gemmatimonadaceae bacterium]